MAHRGLLRAGVPPMAHSGSPSKVAFCKSKFPRTLKSDMILTPFGGLWLGARCPRFFGGKGQYGEGYGIWSHNRKSFERDGRPHAHGCGRLVRFFLIKLKMPSKERGMKWSFCGGGIRAPWGGYEPHRGGPGGGL